ncbi:hypothetical protein MXL46_20925 [Heyndrickxia sporothermodurans]|uniref:hypothetical protein n=1 Tax=Bacilli TaxID=91061 RepID=UPI0012E0D08C|nr:MULTISPECIES: hypothetical protein [Bacilli]MEB6551472.1 hypothetical protein [Heyndrickxia sporothermodurans]QGU39461.1 hypothetical protein F5989_00050 [Streptococcus mutans]HAJ4014855.1 hypothetical protein [Escherichia coli]HAJ4024467.1 hypothetical protein [Escherichia coli]
MKKVLVSVLSLSMLLFGSLVIKPSESEAAAIICKGGYVKSIYSAAGGRVNIEYQDYYLDVKGGRQFASKMGSSPSKAILWFAASWIPAAGPYIGSMTFLSDLNASMAADKIRSYTDNNKKVHVTVGRDKVNGGLANYIVKGWDGSAKSIKAFEVPAPQYQYVQFTTWDYY